MRQILFAGLFALTNLISTSNAAERWYDRAAVTRGNQLFQQHCAVCHGANAEGTADWRTRNAEGQYPPPPLNGSAHAWHHSIIQLARSIKQGSIDLGGSMPPFGHLLNDVQVLQLIAYFQSKWPEDVYARWAQRYPVN